ncbi:MAG: GTP-binding protein [Candidatus Lokiarchaeota archaeon]|nr:GTP-binding protein [Candidatus Lokiarchaeota archaeon]
MSINRQKLFTELFNQFLQLNTDVEAVILSDKQGLVIAGEKRSEVDMEIVSVLTSIINPIVERIRDEFMFKKFGTASFDTDIHRLLFISLDESRTLSVVLNSLASVDKASPYAYLLAEKSSQILHAEEGDKIQLSIPNFEYETDETAHYDRLKNQVYQMRLDEGGVYRFKFVIIGNHEVGKTSLVRRFIENKFSHDYRATIGLNILSHSIEFFGNKIIYSLWDVGAQKYFKRFRQTYYLGTQAAFIVFDLTNRESFENVKEWYGELENFIEGREIPIIIIGNKTDLEDQRVIQYQDGVNLVNELSQKPNIKISYIETSALSGVNVEDAFTLIAYHYISKSKEDEEERVKNDIIDELNSVLKERKVIGEEFDSLLTITIISENEFWSPGLQILTEINDLNEHEKVKDGREEKLYKFSNGITLKNYLYHNFEVAGSDGVFCIFDARDKEHIDPKWKEVVIKIINDIEKNKVVLIGIRVSDKIDWSSIMEEFDVNELLEQKMVSLLFFKLGLEYRLEIYDQLKVMLNTIKFL